MFLETISDLPLTANIKVYPILVFLILPCTIQYNYVICWIVFKEEARRDKMRMAKWIKYITNHRLWFLSQWSCCCCSFHSLIRTLSQCRTLFYDDIEWQLRMLFIHKMITSKFRSVFYCTITYNSCTWYISFIVINCIWSVYLLL